MGSIKSPTTFGSARHERWSQYWDGSAAAHTKRFLTRSNGSDDTGTLIVLMLPMLSSQSEGSVIILKCCARIRQNILKDFGGVVPKLGRSATGSALKLGFTAWMTPIYESPRLALLAFRAADLAKRGSQALRWDAAVSLTTLAGLV
jgi:hypothetical protein